MTIASEFLAKTALVIGSLILSGALLFAGGEIYLQTEHGSVPPGPPAEWNTYDLRRGWTLKPGRYSYFHVQALRRVDVVINELGLRNGPVSRETKPGVERVIVLGDSFVFGPQLNAGETITSQLQDFAGASFEIVNVSVPGYGTGQQYRLVEELQAKGYQLGRKLILVFFTNDIQDNLGLEYSTLERNPWQPSFGVDASGNLQQTVPRPHQTDGGGGRGLLARSLFAQFLRYYLEVLVVSHPFILRIVEAVDMTPSLPRTPGIVAGWHGPQWQSMWRVTEGVLEHLVGAIRAVPDGPEIFIAFVPSPFQVHEAFRRIIEAGADGDARYASFLSDPDRPQRVLQALASRLDVPFIDMTPALRRAAARSLLYFPREGHFTEAGSAITARVTYEQAIQKKAAVASSVKPDSVFAETGRPLPTEESQTDVKVEGEVSPRAATLPSRTTPPPSD